MVTDRSEIPAEEFSDRSILEYLRRHGAATISELVELAGVTTTAIRQRVKRLMKQGLVVRQTESRGRGRPAHCYSLSPAGERSGGHNCQDLAVALWSEIRAVEDPEIRRGLLKRVVVRIAEDYRNRIEGNDIRERMESLVDLMNERDVPFEVGTDDSQLPVLTAWACPYPDLAEQDRGICSMEKMLFTEVLGESVRLSGCRLDGDNCCTFEPSSPTV